MTQMLRSTRLLAMNSWPDDHATAASAATAAEAAEAAEAAVRPVVELKLTKTGVESKRACVRF